MGSSKINTLIILGGNPAYNAPADSGFAENLKNVPSVIRLGYHFDETSKLASWHIPESHYLESWGDSISWDGTPGIIQPMIEPLYGTRSKLEMLLLLLNGNLENVKEGEKELTPAYAAVRQTWRQIIGPSDQQFRRLSHWVLARSIQ